MDWIRNAYPGAEQLGLHNLGAGPALDDAVKAHSYPPQVVTKGRYPAIEAYRATNIRTDWTEAGTERFVLAHDNPEGGDEQRLTVWSSKPAPEM